MTWQVSFWLGLGVCVVGLIIWAMFAHPFSPSASTTSTIAPGSSCGYIRAEYVPVGDGLAILDEGAVRHNMAVESCYERDDWTLEDQYP